MYPLDDTIAAISSAPGGAARGMVRLSGPQTLACLRRCFRADCETAADTALDSPSTATAIRGSLDLPRIAAPLPCEVYVWPRGRSYTGALTAEIHTLGSPPLLAAVLSALCGAGARLAEPGEFTLRAFLAGRIDLTQAEAVLGVIDAADPGQLSAALTQLAGGLAGPLHRLRDALIDLLVHLEAGFDFAEEDLPFLTTDQLHGRLAEAIDHLDRLARQMASRCERTETIRVVLVGRPNAGKSSLFNALIRYRGALVADEPGTTRDYLTAELDLDGVKCQLIDTAGLAAEFDLENGKAEADRNVAHAAQTVTLEQDRRAHVRIVCLDSTRLTDDVGTDVAATSDARHLVVLTKADAADGSADRPEALPTSSMTGHGIDELRQWMREAVLEAAAGDGEVVAGTAVRCGASLQRAVESLHHARELAEAALGEELIAAEIRVALDELGKVVGAVYTDDLLERIFSRFCIGK